MRSRQADEYRNLEEDFRQRHQRLHEAHEQEIQNCIRRYFAKNNQDQPEDLSLHRHASSSDVHQNLTQSHQPLVTLASPNFLMPPAPMPQNTSSHSSQEDCSGISYTVKHKLQEHLMRKHSNCDIAGISSAAASASTSQVKMRPVIRTYSAPLPLTNAAFFQPPTPGMPGPGAASLDPYPIPTPDQEMYNIKQHIRNSGLQKSKVILLFRILTVRRKMRRGNENSM